MANWCHNMLTVKVTDEEGSAKQLADFIAISKKREEETELSLHKTIPMPQSLFDAYQDSKHEKYEELHSWFVDNWGITHDVIAGIHKQEETFITYYFDSKWVPPVKWLESVALKYPQLHFYTEFWEDMGNFRGTGTAHNEQFDVTREDLYLNR